MLQLPNFDPVRMTILTHAQSLLRYSSNSECECWWHIVLASLLLLKYKILPSAIAVADALLLRFCVNFKRFYGGSAVTPNIHMHCHLEDFGPVIVPFGYFHLE